MPVDVIFYIIFKMLLIYMVYDLYHKLFLYHLIKSVYEYFDQMIPDFEKMFECVEQ